MVRPTYAKEIINIDNDGSYDLAVLSQKVQLPVEVMLCEAQALQSAANFFAPSDWCIC